MESCGNSRLAEAIRRSREYYFNYRIAAVYTAAEVAEAIGGHLAIAGPSSAGSPKRQSGWPALMCTRRWKPP